MYIIKNASMGLQASAHNKFILYIHCALFIHVLCIDFGTNLMIKCITS